MLACSEPADREVSPQSLFDAAAVAIADAPPTTDVMQLELDQPCVMVDNFSVDARGLELVGSATALFGDIGERYQCAWSGDVDGPANIRLEVVFVEAANDFATYLDLVESRAGNEIVATSIGDVAVASFTPEAGGLPVATAIFTDRSRRAGVQLVVELVDPVLRERWAATEYADLLARFGQ